MVSAQQEKKTEFQALVGHYMQLFPLLGGKSKPDVELFRPYFSRDAVTLDNQYYDGGTRGFDNALDYLVDIIEFFYANGIEHLQISQSDPGVVLYGKAGDDYYAWVYQCFTYVFRERRVDLHGWVEIHARRDPEDGVLRIVAVHSVGGAPADEDGDQIADVFDLCVPSPQGVETGLNGCPLQAEEPVEAPVTGSTQPGEQPAGQEQRTTRDPPKWDKIRIWTRVVKGRRVIKTQDVEMGVGETRSPRSPSSRFSLDLSYGILGEVSDDDRTVSWNNGYSGDFGLHLHATRYLDFGIGLLHLYDAMGVSGFQANIVNYLVANNVPFTNISASSDAFHYNMVYASFGVGNYRSTRVVASLEPLAGMVYSNWVFPNQLGVTIQYTGEGTPTTKFSMATRPFFGEGLKAMLQLGMDKNGMVRLQISGYYLQSNDQLGVNQELQFANSRGGVAVPEGRFRFLAAMVGLHFTLHRPGKFSLID